MSPAAAEIDQAPQVVKPAKIKLSVGLTSASFVFFIIGGVLLRIGNAAYYDDDDGYYGFWAGGVTCLVFAALIFIAALVTWTITFGRQKMLARSSQAISLQAARDAGDNTKDGTVTQTRLLDPYMERSIQSPVRFMSPSGYQGVQATYRPVEHDTREAWNHCTRCGGEVNTPYCPSCGAAM